jgi:hypothetical protein
MIHKIAAALLVFALVGSPGFAKGSHSRGSSHKSGATRSASPEGHTKKQSSSSTSRTSHGRIRRSAQAKAEFMRQTGYPHGRPGYVVDHVTPLACGGADAPYNMQWQTIAAGKAKDKTERIGCR